MSSHIALIATEPVRASVSAEQVRREVGEQMPRAGGQSISEPLSPTASTAPAPAQPAEPEVRDVKDAVERIRNFVTDVRRELQFSVDEDSGRTIITVIDSDSGKIIRQIPPEEILEIARSVANGGFNLIDSRA